MISSEDARMHLGRARQAEALGDFLGARISHMQSVECCKRDGDAVGIEEANIEYSNFVRRDPMFKALITGLQCIIQENPGVIQSDISKTAESMEWPDLRRYNRPLTREDISYALYFAAEFDMITRTKKGRSYELRLPMKVVQ